MSLDVVGTAGSGANRIGRYFTVVSALPSAVFCSYVYLLARTDAWSGRPDWSAAIDFDPRQLIVVGLLALVLALALNPLQVGLIRLFEGYWGPGLLARDLAAMRIAHHRRRLGKHDRDALYASGRLAAAEERDVTVLQGPDLPPDRLAETVQEATNRIAAGEYPDYPLILPTRLGNVLRRYESQAGLPYEIDVIRSIPRLAMVASDAETGYLQNQRVQLELAVRTAFFGLLATTVTVAFMWRHGLWLLLALAPYTVAFLAYRGAVMVAHEYGLSITVMIDLSRFKLYENLRLPRPRSHSEERAQNRRLMRVFGLERADLGRYDHEPASAAGPASQPTAADGPQPSDLDQEQP